MLLCSLGMDSGHCALPWMTKPLVPQLVISSLDEACDMFMCGVGCCARLNRVKAVNAIGCCAW